MTAYSRTAEEALARARRLHQECGCAKCRKWLAEDEAGYRIEAAGLREAQEFIEPSPEYDEWLRAAASDLGTLIRVAFRLLDEVIEAGGTGEIRLGGEVAE